jgi:hypothetical protein
MIGLLCFALAVLASPFKSKLRLEAENEVGRALAADHQVVGIVDDSGSQSLLRA